MIANSGRIYGTAYEDAGELGVAPNIAVYEDGAVTVLTPGVVYTANQGGTIGGSVVVDLANFVEQAALFRGSAVQLIPRLPGEVTSHVIRLTDSGIALVVSYDESSQPTYVLRKNGKAIPLDFRTNTEPLDINNQGIIAGVKRIPGQLLGDRGFRFDPRTGKVTLLEPLPTEPNSWAQDINNNNRGNVLGYSFVPGHIERIGVWDRNGQFHTYFVEGTPEFPTISNRLRFNDNNLIVISLTSASSNRNSYLVPKPGVRLNLADLVENLPSTAGPLWIINHVNNHGDMIGSGFDGGDFLLKRVGAGVQ